MIVTADNGTKLMSLFIQFSGACNLIITHSRMKVDIPLHSLGTHTYDIVHYFSIKVAEGKKKYVAALEQQVHILTSKCALHFLNRVW